MFRLTAQLCVSAEREQADVAITVVNQVIWLALAQLQLARDQSQVLAVAQVLLVVDLVEGSFPVVDLLVDPALLLATSAVDLTISPVTVKLRL